jgi:hypothetical protein
MTPVELATEARAHVARVIASLERPTMEALDRSVAELASAKERIEQLNKEQVDGAAALKSALLSLRKDLRLAALLLRCAWQFRAAACGQAGYTPAGELSPEIVSANRWILEG